MVDAMDPDVAALVADLHARLVLLLDRDLLGVYVFGSVAAGAYDPGVSDVDLLVVTAQPLAAAGYAQLRRMHDELSSARPQWAHRVDVAYLDREALRTAKQRTSAIGVIGPGKPFQVVQGGRDWLLEWNDVREHAVVVAGPDPRDLIGPIDRTELDACCRDYVRLFPAQVRDHPHRGSDAYAVLTMCRALHLHVVGETTTKGAAAEWAARHHPQWRDVIIQAQAWRLAADDETNSAEVHARVRALVDFTVDTLH